MVMFPRGVIEVAGRREARKLSGGSGSLLATGRWIENVTLARPHSCDEWSDEQGDEQGDGQGNEQGDGQGDGQGDEQGDDGEERSDE